jgi:hypothetical protein
MGIFDGLLAEILGLLELAGGWVAELLAGLSAFFTGFLS